VSGLRSFAVLAVVALTGAAVAAPPEQPRAEDECTVIAGTAPRVEIVPPRWQEQVLRDSGWTSRDRRVYTLPTVLDCRGDSEHRRSGWACARTFLDWAKRNCPRLEIRE
jgi:hypothetical protein